MKTEGRRKALNTSAFSLTLVDLQPDLAVVHLFHFLIYAVDAPTKPSFVTLHVPC